MTDTWHVEWQTINTPGELLFLLVSQLAPQVAVGSTAGQKIIGGTYSPETASAFLFSAGVVGDFFWPSPGRGRKPVASAFPNRARDLRHLLGLPEAEFSQLDSIRNDLAHVDERMEELYLDNPTAPLLAWGGGGVLLKDTRRYLNYDPTTGTLHSLGIDVDVAAFVAWLESLQARIGRITMPLFLRMHDIGHVSNTAEEESTASAD
ncbi:hypothetical protein [Agrococcus sp. Ld7]|uniref:hypothetical protein n=1 Tax=Agrococcus sp. Ld7 TaxID=649148 RepID=UPI00386A78B6